MAIDPIPLPPALIAPKASSFQFRPTDEGVPFDTAEGTPIDAYDAPSRHPDDEGIVVVTNAGGFLKGIPLSIMILSGYAPATLASVYGITKTDLLAIDAYIAGYAQGREDIAMQQKERSQKRELRKAQRLKKLLALALENEA